MDAQIQAGGAMGQPDADFAKGAYDLVQMDNLEGKLAADKASDPRIKVVAAQVMAQANSMYPGVQAAMRAEKISQPDRLSDELQAKVEGLGKLNGRAFDKQYVSDQLASHERAVQLLQQESTTTKNSVLRSQAQLALPVVQNNLARFKILAAELNKPAA